MVKVVYRDGNSEVFPTNDYSHSSEHKMFFVVIGGCRLMIPDDAVRTIGKGRVDTIVAMSNGEQSVLKEVFVYE